MRTRVGYAGGTLKDPTYHSLGDHTETVQIDFDPTRITYARLLEVFWSSHDPCGRPGSRQYASILFYHNEEQKRLAGETRDRLTGLRGAVTTEIVPFTVFYRAEDYHQKYSLRATRELMKEFRAMYADERGFMNSTAAARVNGYLAGYGSAAALAAELGSLGLSPEAGRKLLAAVKGR